MPTGLLTPPLTPFPYRPKLRKAVGYGGVRPRAVTCNALPFRLL